MNKLAYKCFYFLGLTLVPILGSAQNKDSNTTVKDSISDNLIIVNDSLDNQISTARKQKDIPFKKPQKK